MKYINILDKIQNEVPFAFTRWGDGEWYNVNKKSGKNTDGNIYYKDLGDELLKIVKIPQDYFMGHQSLMEYSVKESQKYPQDWVDADIFHRASIAGNLDKLISTLHDKYVVYIGNRSLKKLDFINEFIEIPYNNCWITRDKIINQIKNTFDDSFKVYCFSAGMAANVFIDRLWKFDNTNTYLDMGSVFDPYVGRNTRGYHKKLKIKNVEKSA